jgi:hypothetical protein
MNTPHTTEGTNYESHTNYSQLLERQASIGKC